MAHINIDLADGLPDVSFNLKAEDTVRFQAFMSKYSELQDVVNKAHQRLENIVSANAIPMPSDLRVTALTQCTESLLKELAPHVDWE